MEEEILIRYMLDESTEEERREVMDWLSENESNAWRYAQLEKIWVAGKKLAAASPADTEAAWMRFREKVARNVDRESHQLPVSEAVVRPMRRNFKWMQTAAAVMLVGMAWIAYQWFGKGRYEELVSHDIVRREKLPDGSELTLNKNTVISYAARFENNRHLKLKEGEAFFDVAHDKSHPFVIDIEEVSVTVVGTSFNIRHHQDSTEVIVETGIVRVSLNGKATELHKGEKVLISSAHDRLNKEQNTDDLYDYYRSNLFVASNLPLQRLVDVMNEAYGKPRIVIKDPSVAAEIVNTTFRVDSGLDYAVQLICTMSNLKAERNENEILLSRVK